MVVQASGLRLHSRCSQNCLLSADGTVKLTDFGISATRITAAGTPAYMAPELLAEKPYSKAADTYAFAVLLWVRAIESWPEAATFSASHGFARNCIIDVVCAPCSPQELLARRIPFAGWRAPDIRDAVIGGTRPDLSALPLDTPRAIRDLITASWAPAGPARPGTRCFLADAPSAGLCPPHTHAHAHSPCSHGCRGRVSQRSPESAPASPVLR